MHRLSLVSATMHIRRLFLAILAISFFWTIGAVAHHHLPAAGEGCSRCRTNRWRASSSPFSGSESRSGHRHQPDIKSEVSARYCASLGNCDGRLRPPPPLRRADWSKHGPDLTTLENFLFNPLAWPMILCLLGVAISGGMYVVPLYAFLTTTVPKTETARTVAANKSSTRGRWSWVRCWHSHSESGRWGRLVSCCWSRRCA